MFWCIPLTSHQKNLDFYQNFTDPYGRKVALILAQLRLLSPKRFLRYLYSFPCDQLEQTKEKLKRFL